MAKMSDKTKRAINKGRRKAGLKPIKFGAKHEDPQFKRYLKTYEKPQRPKTEVDWMRLEKTLQAILKSKKGTDAQRRKKWLAVYNKYAIYKIKR